MTLLSLENVTLDFPIYNASSRSLKKSLMNVGSGGLISQDANNGIIIRALENVSIHLEEGDRLGLIGHNGAGKSTLLRVMAGVYEPTGGSVSREGSVAPLFNVFLGIDEEANGYENIHIQGLYHGLNPKEINERMDEIAEFTELGNYLSMPVRTYSTGMKMRLCFAVSTCIQPEILLMDEWLGTGDAHFQEKATQRLDEFVERSGILVLATHSNELIQNVCNKAVLLEHGQVKMFGPVEDILDAYMEPSYEY